MLDAEPAHLKTIKYDRDENCEIIFLSFLLELFVLC